MKVLLIVKKKYHVVGVGVGVALLFESLYCSFEWLKTAVR